MIVEEPTSASTKQVDQPLTKMEEECSGNEEVMMNDDEQNTAEDTPNVFSSLLDVLGLQGQCLEDRVDLTGRIQRVYWREVRSRKQTLNCRRYVRFITKIRAFEKAQTKIRKIDWSLEIPIIHREMHDSQSKAALC